MMITADIQLTAGFNRGVAALIHQAGLNAVKVVRKETGELIKTLVRLSPKADSKKIKDDITRKFQLINLEHTSNRTPGHGVNWYAWTSDRLFGVAAHADKTKATVEELKSLLYRVKKSGGRLQSRRGKQTVLVIQKITTKRSTVNKLAAQKARNRGRLAAGWLVATASGPIHLTGTQPPGWIMRHAKGARGAFISELGNEKFPAFTIINRAKGIGAKQVDRIVKVAVKIRGVAMEKNALIFMQGKKNIADYR